MTGIKEPKRWTIGFAIALLWVGVLPASGVVGNLEPGADENPIQHRSPQGTAVATGLATGTIELPTDGKTKAGEVQFFNAKKGYGFITYQAVMRPGPGDLAAQGGYAELELRLRVERAETRLDTWPFGLPEGTDPERRFAQSHATVADVPAGDITLEVWAGAADQRRGLLLETGHIHVVVVPELLT